jgi:hypothetical protein
MCSNLIMEFEYCLVLVESTWRCYERKATPELTAYPEYLARLPESPSEGLS